MGRLLETLILSCSQKLWDQISSIWKVRSSQISKINDLRQQYGKQDLNVNELNKSPNLHRLPKIFCIQYLAKGLAHSKPSVKPAMETWSWQTCEMGRGLKRGLSSPATETLSSWRQALGICVASWWAPRSGLNTYNKRRRPSTPGRRHCWGARYGVEVQESLRDLGSECQMKNGWGLGPQVTLRGKGTTMGKRDRKTLQRVQGSVAV